jgi:ubiquinone/menaquinone biosynthesis C-methylase UbiE/uncharacterized membrane protein YbhN (UPF0104 family)
MASRRWLVLTAALVALGAAISVLWILASGGTGVLGSLTRVSAGSLVLLVSLTAFHLGVRFLRWQFLLRRAGVRLPARASLRGYLASLVGIATPAYFGEVLRCAFARRNHGAPLSVTLTVLVMERLLDVFAIALIGIVGALRAEATWEPFVIGGAALVLCLAIASLARFALPPSAPAAALRSARTLVPAVASSLVAWIPASLTVAVAASALGDGIPVVDGVRVFCQSTLLGGLTLMPAGLGATGTAALLELRDLGWTTEAALPVVALFRWTTTGFALSVGAAFLLLELLARRERASLTAARHFDEIAPDYENQYAPHVWRLVLERKVKFLTEGLVEPPERAGVGLDFGCGLGHQCVEMRGRGFRVVGVDPSFALLRHARKRAAPVAAGDGLALPLRDSSVDFVYAIGVLHHLPDARSQDLACREVARVLKPGGRFLVVETNTRNPLFRFYMGYVFPLMKTIDEGTELWLDPRSFERRGDLVHLYTRYFTFVPDTIPRPLMPAFLWIERLLEASRLRPYAVHYMGVLRKPEADDVKPTDDVKSANDGGRPR